MISLSKPVVIIVGSDKGGVGKTTVSRTLLDYLGERSVPVKAFDTESPRGTLKRFHGEATEIVDLTVTTGQMRVFDALFSGAPAVTIIDVRAGVMSTALQALKEVGFLQAAKSGKITFVVLHVLGSSIASLDEIVETAKYMEGAKYFLVKNHTSKNTFFEWDKATYDGYFNKIQGAVELNIPKLDEMAFEQVEASALPFAQFSQDDKYSFICRGKVNYWRSEIEQEFNRVSLMETIGAAK